MKKTVLFFVISGAVVQIINVCSKKNDAQSYTVKQLAGTYKLTASTSTSSGITVDNVAQMDACEKDDLMKLQEDSTIVFVDAGIQCASGGDYSAKFTVKGNLLIQSPGTDYADKATIKSFSGSTQVLTTAEKDQGVPVLTTVTFARLSPQPFSITSMWEIFPDR
ncbi:lipocalin family protein [Flavitalea sp. BT771]|uniref:lipocalin family protein n=1 Tax=Flavitalea sp. BT771 TaxID=3063329 RepID=UPI0026E1C77C|nr:lipocalin family protein [Flavitalea sp. BT771]MDO6433863.1 lipocalin family protein [Flavitalea sp. BT771]MDV6222232.1 lipocalin family protein [Flavitalea sp. BT771]